MLHTEFQAPEPRSSGEEDFEVHFIFEPKTCPPQDHFGSQGHHSNKLGRGPLGNATYQNIKALGLVVSEKMFFNAIVDDARRTTDIGQCQ